MFSDRWTIEDRRNQIVSLESSNAFGAYNAQNDLTGHEFDILLMTKLSALHIAQATVSHVYEICQLTALRILSIRHTRIAEIPSAIGRLVHLRSLVLDSNGLKTIPQEVGNLRSLQVLTVMYNKLVDLPPTLARLSNLERLGLANNRLKEIPPFVCALPKLRKLLLGCNKITVVPDAFSDLSPCLEQINLVNNPLMYIHMKCNQPKFVYNTRHRNALLEYCDTYGWVVDAENNADLREETYECLDALSYAYVYDDVGLQNLLRAVRRNPYP
jgi:Leucine-rich repeat (LRR) protein